jgi:hypothetical protein
VERVRAAPPLRRPALLANLAEAYLDKEPDLARRLLDEAVVDLPAGVAPPPWFAVPMYRLGDRERFEAALRGLDDDGRGEVWDALAREWDVDPTREFMAHASEGKAQNRQRILIEVAERRLKEGRGDEVPEPVRDIVASDPGAYGPLAIAARLAWAVGDRAGAARALRAMINAAFEGDERAAVELSLVASFWHCRVPGARP